MIAEYVGVLVLLVLAVSMTFAALVVHWIWAPHRRDRSARSGSAQATGLAAEEGAPVPRRIAVKFYRLAILFLIANAALALLYPWAASFRGLGWSGLVAAGVFCVPLGVGFVYQWRKGALEW